MWTYIAAVCGFWAGMILGPLSTLGVCARYVVLGKEDCPEITLGFMSGTMLLSLPAAFNGMIGSLVAFKTKIHHCQPVAYIPAIIHILAIIPGVMEKNAFFGVQLYALMYSSIIWLSGRVGQRIGLVMSATQRVGSEPEEE